MPENSKTERTS